VGCFAMDASYSNGTRLRGIRLRGLNIFSETFKILRGDYK